MLAKQPKPVAFPVGRAALSTAVMAAVCLGGSGASLPAMASAATAAVQSPQDPPQEPAKEATPQASTPAAGKPFLRGQLNSRLYTRWTSDERDLDLVEILSLDFGDEAKDRVTGHLMGRLAADLDGYDPTFHSINDSYGDRVDGLLYDAYADVHRFAGLEVVRLGRQSLYDTPEYAFFDGARVESRKYGSAELMVGGYFGASTHLYESSPKGDLLGGAFVEGRPWASGRLRLDWMHMEDGALLGDNRNDLLGAGFWQRLCSHLDAEAHYTRLEGKDRDVSARAVFQAPAQSLLLQGTFYELLQPQGDLVLEADPFFNAVHELDPYHQWGVLGSKGFGEWLQLSAGADTRRVRDRSDVGPYNRDYARYYFTATLLRLPVEHLELAGTADFWNSDVQLVRTWGADARYHLDELKITAGTYYSLYKFDLFSAYERDHVRTWFGKLQHKLSPKVSADVGYEYETDDLDKYQTIRMGVTWRF